MGRKLKVGRKEEGGTGFGRRRGGRREGKKDEGSEDGT